MINYWSITPHKIPGPIIPELALCLTPVSEDDNELATLVQYALLLGASRVDEKGRNYVFIPMQFGIMGATSFHLLDLEIDLCDRTVYADVGTPYTGQHLRQWKIHWSQAAKLEKLFNSQDPELSKDWLTPTEEDE